MKVSSVLWSKSLLSLLIHVTLGERQKINDVQINSIPLVDAVFHCDFSL